MAPLLPPVSKQNVLACASYEAWACFELNLGTNFVESLRLRKDDVGEELWRRESDHASGLFGSHSLRNRALHFSSI
jgi:hypothetical protein